MTFSKETQIKLIDYRLNLLYARGAEMNRKLINALEREKRNLQKKRPGCILERAYYQ